MERLKPHGVAPGSDGQVLVTVGGVAQWMTLTTGGDGGGGGDDDPGTGGLTSTAEVVASTSAYFTAAPYTVPLPALPPGITSADITLVVVMQFTNGPALNSETGPAGVPGGWTRRGWGGTTGGRTAVVLSAPLTAVDEYEGAAPASVTLGGVGAGHCQVFLLCVDNAGGLRGTPGLLTVVDDTTTVEGNDLAAPGAGDPAGPNGPAARGWSTLTGSYNGAFPGWEGVRTDDEGVPDVGVGTSASYGAPGEEQSLMASLDRTGRVDLTYQPLLIAEVWDGPTGMRSDGQHYAVADGIVLPRLADVAISGDQFRRVTWLLGRPADHLRFRAGKYEGIGPGYDFWIRKVSKQAGANVEVEAVSASMNVLNTGTPAIIGDLVVVFAGGRATHGDLAGPTGATLEVTRSDDDLRGSVWTYPATASGVAQPTVKAATADTGLIVAAVSVAGQAFGGGGGTGLPSGGNEGDVLTRVGSDAVWAPPPSGLPELLGTEGQVLTIVDGVPEWADATSGGRCLVPLTTTVAGEPTFLWTTDNHLMLAEETL